MVTVWAALLPLLLASTADAEDFSGPVVSVLEGDTIEVLHNKHLERIRLKASTVRRKAKLPATMLSTPPQS
jgi:endonuclease YncB( thermonuclease family)